MNRVSVCLSSSNVNRSIRNNSSFGFIVLNFILSPKKPDPEKGESTASTESTESKVDTTKMDEITNMMNDKMGKLDAFMNILEKKTITGDAAATIGNVKEIFTDSIKEQVSEAASDAVSDAIDKVEVKKVDE